MMRILPSIAMAVLVALTGCTSPKTTLLTLDTAPPAPGAIHADYCGEPIAVPAVHLPAALDRSEFIHQETAAEVEADDFARWTAPLGLLARDTLVRDLTARLPSGLVLPPGTLGTPGKTRSLDVTIVAFQVGSNSATLQAAYQVLPSGPLRQSMFSTQTAGIGPVPTAQVLGALIGQLADRIASDMASPHYPTPSCDTAK